MDKATGPARFLATKVEPQEIVGGERLVSAKMPTDPAGFDGALAMIGKIADEVVAYRVKLAEAGVEAGAADRMVERMGDALMAAVEVGIAKAKGGAG